MEQKHRVGRCFERFVNLGMKWSGFLQDEVELRFNLRFFLEPQVTSWGEITDQNRLVNIWRFFHMRNPAKNRDLLRSLRTVSQSM